MVAVADIKQSLQQSLDKTVLITCAFELLSAARSCRTSEPALPDPADETRRDETRQDTTIPYKTRQDKTRQNQQDMHHRGTKANGTQHERSQERVHSCIKTIYISEACASNSDKKRLSGSRNDLRAVKTMT
eukprot:COSAG06_NODE_24676_length_655_cov_21.802158_1_plen_131_part_00